MPSSYGEFFYFSICHVCKDYSQDIRRCSSCKTVAYCSQKHQKLDWKKHKNLCRAITQTVKNEKITNFEDWKRYRLWCQQVWRKFLKRDLEPFECQMWMFQRVCNVCYTRENLIDCNECYNVAYCCQSHKEQDKTHTKFCAKLKLCLEIDRYLVRTNTYFSLEFKDNIIIPSLLSLDISRLLNIIEDTPSTQILEGVNEKIEHILKEDCLVLGATILYAIEVSQMQFQGSHLIVHIAGASSLEATSDWRPATEIILHRMRNVQTITYILIGPEAWYMPSPNVELCNMCNQNQKSFEVRIYTELYHDIVHTLEKPDIVIAFNSGFHDFDAHDENSWQKSIPLLLNYPSVPFAFTSYTKDEMLKDLQYIKDIPDVNISILKSVKNPFASTRPIRDWCSFIYSAVFYSNAYITLCKRL